MQGLMFLKGRGDFKKVLKRYSFPIYFIDNNINNKKIIIIVIIAMFSLIKIVLFSTPEVITCSKVIKRWNSWTDPSRKSSIWDFYSMDMNCYK